MLPRARRRINSRRRADFCELTAAAAEGPRSACGPWTHTCSPPSGAELSRLPGTLPAARDPQPLSASPGGALVGPAQALQGAARARLHCSSGRAAGGAVPVGCRGSRTTVGTLGSHQGAGWASWSGGLCALCLLRCGRGSPAWRPGGFSTPRRCWACVAHRAGSLSAAPGKRLLKTGNDRQKQHGDRQALPHVLARCTLESAPRGLPLPVPGPPPQDSAWCLPVP